MDLALLIIILCGGIGYLMLVPILLTIRRYLGPATRDLAGILVDLGIVLSAMLALVLGLTIIRGRLDLADDAWTAFRQLFIAVIVSGTAWVFVARFWHWHGRESTPGETMSATVARIAESPPPPPVTGPH